MRPIGSGTISRIPGKEHFQWSVNGPRSIFQSVRGSESVKNENFISYYHMTIIFVEIIDCGNDLLQKNSLQRNALKMGKFQVWP